MTEEEPVSRLDRHSGPKSWALEPDMQAVMDRELIKADVRIARVFAARERPARHPNHCRDGAHLR